MTPTRKRKSLSHMMQIYVGYGDRGAARELAIRQAVAQSGVKFSKLVLDLLKERFPKIGL